ncbi:MAG: HNH endonuclease [Longimicrobiales bacterium]
MFPRPNADSEKRAAQRRADALGLLAEQALAAGFENGPVSGSRATRYQVVLHVEPDALRDPDEPGIAESAPGPSELEDGTHVSAETSRRIACDAGLVRVTHAPGAIDPAQSGIGPISEGTVLDVGRKTRTIPPAIRRALEVRDRGCRFPGCGSRFTDAHHVKHWADGGETSLDNCLLLCRHHHRLVHEGGWRVDWWGRGRPVFFDPRGGTHFEGRWRRGWEGVAQPEGGGPMWLTTRPSVEEGRKGGTRPTQGAEGKVATLLENNRGRGVTPDGGDGVETFVRENLLRDVKPDPWTASARWRREADIPDDIYFRGLEAIQDPVP